MQEIPPNQVVTDKFPVMSIGDTPHVDKENFSLRVFGEVDNEISISWKDLTSYPMISITTDFHCVTGWSRINDTWEGIRLSLVLDKVKPKGHFVMLHSADGYSTNIPIEYAMMERSILALKFNGNPLRPEHGGPVRALIPYLYGWKSAKWIVGIEVMRDNIPGFWERRGYHMLGDPWKEQRYAEKYDLLSIINIRKRRK
ncbi:putative oxidoreductase YuiH [Sulfolobales archaeon HS-7]|nr:putative oxidoreductase YuiH [Sulfolobales archaeon HS-7]